jgi:hypothetical protein
MSIRCEEVVAAMATGGPIRRWRARRHAARCTRCATARDELKRVAETLADVAPLTLAQRRLWVAAAGDEISKVPLWTWWFRPALAGVLIAVIAGAVGVWRAFRPVDRLQAPAVVQVTPPGVKEGTLRDTEGLRSRVVDLAQELDDLRARAELLDARKNAAALMARLAPPGVSSGL